MLTNGILQADVCICGRVKAYWLLWNFHAWNIDVQYMWIKNIVVAWVVV